MPIAKIKVGESVIVTGYFPKEPIQGKDFVVVGYAREDIASRYLDMLIGNVSNGHEGDGLGIENLYDHNGEIITPDPRNGRREYYWVELHQLEIIHKYRLTKTKVNQILSNVVSK